MRETIKVSVHTAIDVKLEDLFKANQLSGIRGRSTALVWLKKKYPLLSPQSLLDCIPVFSTYP